MKSKTIKKTALIKESNISIEPHVGKVVIPEQKIKKEVKELAVRITKDYENRSPLVVGILKGAGVFLADLVRNINIDIQIDYMAVSSYGASTKTSGVVRILKDLDEDIKDRHVIIIEDIVDSGLTLSYLMKNLGSRKPASIEICTLLKKKGTQRLKFDIKYQGFTIDDIFVVGYGLDFKQKYRNLKSVHELNNAPLHNGH